MEASGSRPTSTSQATGSGQENTNKENEDIAMSEQSPTPDYPAPPRPSRLLSSVQFQNWMLRLEYRDLTSIQAGDSVSFSIQDPYTQSTAAMMPDLIADQYRSHSLKDYHPGLISYHKLAGFVERDLGFSLDLGNLELGYILPSLGRGLRGMYSTISSVNPELSLRSALSSMFNSQRLKEGQAVLTLYLWYPIPTMPITFLPSSEVADTARAKRWSAAPPISKPKDHQPPRVPNQPDQTPEPVSLDPPAQSTPPNRSGRNHLNEDEDQESIIFDVNALTRRLTPSRPERAHYSDDDEEAYQQALQAWQKDKDERERENEFDMASITKCQHMEPPNWKATCRFFHHSESQTQPEWIVRVHGFGRRLLPVQAHSVWWALKMIHGDVGGVMICHAMGIGKTTTAFAIHYVQHRVNLMWQDITDRPEEHLSSDDDITAPNNDNVCPSNDSMLRKYGFDCPCCPSSPTYFIKQKLGTSVALVPLGLIATWKHEHEACFGSHSKQKLYIAHHEYESQNEPGIWKLLEGTEQTTEELATDVIPTANPAEGYEKHAGPSIFTPRIQNGRCFVLSTSQSIEKKFLDHPSNQGRNDWILQELPRPKRKTDPSQGTVKPKPKSKEGRPYQRCIVSMIFKDEFQHQPTEAEKPITAIMRRQSSFPNSNIALIPMSGTPLTSGPLDIARWVDMMQKPSWKDHPVLKNWCNGEVKEMGLRWKSAISKAGTPSPNDLKELESIRTEVHRKLPALVETLFVRSTTESRIGNHSVVKVPRATFGTLYCVHSERNQEIANDIGKSQQETFDRREAARREKYQRDHRGSLTGYIPLSKTNVNTFYRSRVCASFPYLAKLTHGDGELLKLTYEEWVMNIKAKKWKPGTNSDPYWSHLDQIVASSGKLTRVAAFLDSFENQRDAENKRCRHIFISYFFVVVYIFELWMKQTRGVPPEDLIAVNAYETPTSRSINEALARFHVDIGSKTPVEDQHTAQFILATSSAISIGLTLAEAISVNFLEPDYNAGKIAQGFARHCRQGNKNAQVFCNIFLAKGNRVEEKIMDISELRKQIEAVQNRKHKTIEISS